MKNIIIEIGKSYNMSNVALSLIDQLKKDQVLLVDLFSIPYHRDDVNIRISSICTRV